MLFKGFEQWVKSIVNRLSSTYTRKNPVQGGVVGVSRYPRPVGPPECQVAPNFDEAVL